MGNATSGRRETNQVTEQQDEPSPIENCAVKPAICGRLMIEYSAKPFKTSEHVLTRDNAIKRGIWLKCSHNFNGHAFQLNDHTVLSFPTDREASLIYAYDSSQDTFSKYIALSMSPCERYVTAAAYSLFNSSAIYVVTQIEGSETMSLINFDFSAMRWERVAMMDKSRGQTQKIVGAVMLEHTLLVVGSRYCWIYDVISRDIRIAKYRGGRTARFVTHPRREEEVNLCFMRNTGRVLMVVHGDAMYTLRLTATADGCELITKRVSLQLIGHRFRDFASLERFGCVVAENGARALLFTESGSIMVIDTKTWKSRLSKVACPRESRGSNGLLAWVLTNTDKRGRAVDGYVRERHGEHVTQDVANLIQSYYDDGTWFVHLFMRNKGLHWACDIDSILGVHQFDAETASEAEQDIEYNHALFRLGIQDRLPNQEEEDPVGSGAVEPKLMEKEEMCMGLPEILRHKSATPPLVNY